jgi:F-type H+-transporting ATPase subunit delta
MKNRVLIKRYAQGLVNALGDDAEYRFVGGDLDGFSALTRSRDDLREALTNPFLTVRKRASIVDGVLTLMSCHEKTKRFLGLLVEHGRLDMLDDVRALLPEAWNEKRGVTTYAAVSAVPMTDAQKERLKAALEGLEKRPVSLVARVDPGILGGLTVMKGNIVYDASVEGDLLKLREKIQEG